MKRLILQKSLLLLFLTFSHLQFLTAQTTHTVCGSGCDFTTITSAIAGAAAGDIISITDAVITEQGIVVDKNLTIQSGIASGTIVQAHANEGMATDRVFTINSGVFVTMNHLTIRHGNTTDHGGGILNQGNLAQTNCTISHNSATGNYSIGGGIRNSGTLTQNNCTINNNTGHSGAGINNGGGTLTQTNCTITNNIGINYANGGGIYNASGLLYQTNCTISGNSAAFGGGLATDEGTAHLTNTILADNSATEFNDNFSGFLTTNIDNLCEGCSGTWTSTADPMLGTLADNGGITQTVAITSSSSPAVNPQGGYGSYFDQRGYGRIGIRDIGAFEYGATAPVPALYTVCVNGCDYSSITTAITNAINGDTISILDAVHTEQGIVVNKDMTIQSGNTNGTIVQAHAQSQTATDRVFTINPGVTVTMSDLTIRHGRVTTYEGGGGILNRGNLTQTNCIISGNINYNNSTKGGGINNEGTLTQTNCTISNNRCFGGSYSSGIGIFNAGTLIQTNCTISGNHSDSDIISDGGGILNTGTLTQTNCTISGNSLYSTSQSSSLSSNGGGIFSSGILTQTNCTISGNSMSPSSSSSQGGGMYLGGGTANIINTIIANNSNSVNNNPNFSGTPTSISNSICEGCTTGNWTSTADPLLGTLADNGGTTQTITILDSCSPAVDAGTSTGAPTYDQRGQPRVGAVDIGAFEYQGTPQTIGGTPRPGAGYALEFDGTNQYVEVADSDDLDLVSDFTLETWVKIDAQGKFHGLIEKHEWIASSGGYALRIQDDNLPYLYAIEGQTSKHVIGTTILETDKWFHIAGTFDRANDVIKIYVNGVLEATNSNATIEPSAGLGSLKIGSRGEGGGGSLYKLDGQMDEARIWKTVLSESDIRDWMCKKVTSEHPGICDLAAYYRFDENTGTTLEDVWGDNDGTFVNAPTWTTSGAALGDESTYDYDGNTTTVTQTHTDGSSFKIDDFTGTPDGAHVYLVNEAPSSNNNTLTGDLEETRYYGTFIVGGTSPQYTSTYDYADNTNMGAGDESETRFAKRDNNTSTSWTVGSGRFDLDEIRDEISVCNESGNSEYIVGYDNMTMITERPSSGYALDFDGSTQSVTVPHDASLNLGNTFSFEAWINPETLSSGIGSVISLPSAVDGSGVRLGIRSTGRMEFVVNGGGIMPTNTINVNEWTHLAGTYDGTNFRLYQNGVLIGTSSAFSYYANYTQPLFIGVEGAGAVISPRKFDGLIDEVRIWDTTLSEAEVRDWMCKKVTAGHPEYCDLAAYYRFDENGGNTLTDIVNSNNGTLINAPTYQMSSVPAGDETVYSYNVVNGTSINLTHGNGDQMTVNVTNAGGADAIQLYRVDEEANFNTPPAGLEEVSQYNHWGVKTFGGTGTVYEIVYHYDGHPGIFVESELKLVSRASNATMGWTEETAILDENNNTLTLGGQTGTQFALASKSSNSLPIELINFHAYKEGEAVHLKWSTASETNNRGFDIQHSLDGLTWEKIGFKEGVGNTTTVSNYFFKHEKPSTGINYYRLKQIDTDGKTEILPTQSVDFKSDNAPIQVYPNPAKEILNITNVKGKGMIYNISGQLVMEVNLTEDGINTINVSRLKQGVFQIVLIKNNGEQIVKRFTK